MSTRVQRRRGSAAAHATFIGAEGEITVMTDEKRLVVHDGATPGGIPQARKDEVTADVLRQIGNASFSFQVTDRLVVPNASFTAPRTGTLPAANAIAAGRSIIFFDALPALNGSNILTVARSGSDTINGASSYSCATPRGRWEFVSDGVSKWSVAVERATVDSPALTGTPTAPTAAGGTNTAQIATTAFVKAATDAVVDGAPSNLNTLDKLAGAVGDDPSFSSTMATALGNRLRVDAAQSLTTGQKLQARQNVGITSAGDAVVTAADAAAILTALGFSTFFKTLVDDADGDAVFTTLGAAKSLATSGYQKLPSGLIVQWGFNGSGVQDPTFALPMSFPNANVMTVASIHASGFGGSDAFAAIVYLKGTSSIGVAQRYIGSGSVSGNPYPFSWLALGY